MVAVTPCDHCLYPSNGTPCHVSCNVAHIAAGENLWRYKKEAMERFVPVVLLLSLWPPLPLSLLLFGHAFFRAASSFEATDTLWVVIELFSVSMLASLLFHLLSFNANNQSYSFALSSSIFLSHEWTSEPVPPFFATWYNALVALCPAYVCLHQQHCHCQFPAASINFLIIGSSHIDLNMSGAVASAACDLSTTITMSSMSLPSSLTIVRSVSWLMVNDNVMI